MNKIEKLLSMGKCFPQPICAHAQILPVQQIGPFFGRAFVVCVLGCSQTGCLKCEGSILDFDCSFSNDTDPFPDTDEGVTPDSDAGNGTGHDCELVFRQVGYWPSGWTLNSEGTSYAPEVDPIEQPFTLITENFNTDHIRAPSGFNLGNSWAGATELWDSVADITLNTIEDTAHAPEVPTRDGTQRVQMFTGSGADIGTRDGSLATAECWYKLGPDGSPTPCYHIECDITLVTKKRSTDTADDDPIAWTTDEVTPQIDEFQIKYVLAHEFGHALGIGDIEDLEIASLYEFSVMAGSVAPGMDYTILTGDDEAAAIWIYGKK